METDDARTAVLEAADELFYARGVQAVGMDAVRTAAGIPLKRMYALFPSKADIVAQVLAGRTALWNERILAEAAHHDTPREKILSIFDFLDQWFRAAHAHKRQVVDYVTDLVVEAGCSPELGLQIALLAEGAQTTAAISESPEAAIAARRAAAVLLDAAARP